LHIRNVPETLYDRLKERAQTENRSLSAEVIVLLNQALSEAEQAQADVLASIRRRRFFHPAGANAPDSTTLLREDRQR
jgi:plasmid stability protein